MRIKVIFAQVFILFSISVFSTSKAKCQVPTFVNVELNYIPFNYLSIDLEENSLKILENKVRKLGQDPRALESFKISLTTYYCVSEAEVDSFIGVKRAKIVLDYLCEYTDYPRDKFVIIDPGSISSMPGKSECDVIAVHLGLIKFK